MGRASIGRLVRSESLGFKNGGEFSTAGREGQWREVHV